MLPTNYHSNGVPTTAQQLTGSTASSSSSTSSSSSASSIPYVPSVENLPPPLPQFHHHQQQLGILPAPPELTPPPPLPGSLTLPGCGFLSALNPAMLAAPHTQMPTPHGYYHPYHHAFSSAMTSSFAAMGTSDEEFQHHLAARGMIGLGRGAFDTSSLLGTDSESGGEGVNGGVGKSRQRNLFSPNQVRSLERAFNAARFITSGMRSQIAREVGLTPNQVSVGFRCLVSVTGDDRRF